MQLQWSNQIEIDNRYERLFHIDPLYHWWYLGSLEIDNLLFDRKSDSAGDQWKYMQKYISAAIDKKSHYLVKAREI